VFIAKITLRRTARAYSWVVSDTGRDDHEAWDPWSHPDRAVRYAAFMRLPKRLRDDFEELRDELGRALKHCEAVVEFEDALAALPSRPETD